MSKAYSPTTDDDDRRLHVTYQKESIEVSTDSYPKAPRYGDPALHPFEESISLGDHDDSCSIVSDGFTTMAPQDTPVLAAAKRMRRKNTVKWYLRLLLLIFATLIGFFVSGVVYYATRLAEYETFEHGFAELSYQVVDSVHQKLSQKFLTLDGLSVSLTSQSLTEAQSSLNGSTWPMTTLPHFTQRATNILAAAKSMSVVIAPLVQNDTIHDWNAFLEANAGEWRSRSDSSTTIAVEEQRSSIPSHQLNSSSWNSTSFRVWQHHPRVSTMINADLLSPPTPSLLAFLSSHQAIIGNIMALVPNENPVKDESTYPLNHYMSMLLANNNTRPPIGSEDVGILVSNIYYPIFDSFIVPGTVGATRSMVGVLSMDIIWQDFLATILNIGNNEEIICILRNRCGQEYTFTVRHDRVVNVMEGDMHPAKYDHLVAAVTFDSLNALVQEQGTFQAEMDDFCLFEIQFYPSTTLEEQYLTFKPAIYTASAAFCFVIIFILSLAYERRVAQVHESAVQYRAVVANLFPPAVRQRMFRQSDEDPKPKLIRQGSAKVARQLSPKTLPRQSRSNPTTRATSYSPLTNVNDLTLMPAKPIADHFPNSTILFADIAGFTSWSSERNPEQVFTLLQSLFNLFDGIAKKRQVFKVETIGDCYLAVTGVPEPQADHALRMTKFARECLYRVRPLLDRLNGTLGKGTSDLAMRIGLHSG